MSESFAPKLQEVCEGCYEGVSANAERKFVRTPLMKAAKNDHINCVDALIKQGVDVNALDENFSTALIRAADKGNVDAVEALITAGADINVANVYDANALISACQKGHLKCVNALLQAGAEVDPPKRGSKRNISCLHIALHKGDSQMTKLLINAGADVNESKDLLYLVLLGTKPGHSECLKLLVNSGVNQTLRRSSPLIVAIRDEAKVQVLIEAGADVNTTDVDGMTATMHAAAVRNASCMRLLIDAGADVNARSNTGSTAVMYTIGLKAQVDLPGLLKKPSSYITRTEECINQLVAAGATINAADNHGFTPIARAAQICDVKCLRILITDGADLNVTDNARMTPLMYAGALDCVVPFSHLPPFLPFQDRLRQRWKSNVKMHKTA